MSNDNTGFSEYKIQIGTEDLIESKILTFITEDPDAGVLISPRPKRNCSRF